MNWFHKAKAQPKTDHVGIDPDTLARGDEGMTIFPAALFIPTVNLTLFLPHWSKRNTDLTAVERAAKREFVRRRLEHGAKLSDRSELFAFDETLGEMAEALGMRFSDNPLLNRPMNPDLDIVIRKPKANPDWIEHHVRW